MTKNSGFTTNPLMDLYFQLPNFRDVSESTIINAFESCLAFNAGLALKFLFFIRDIRGGAGERRTFRVILNWISEKYSDKMNEICPLVPEYGRWDDLFSCKDTKSWKTVKKFVISQLKEDMSSEVPSLLGKWMPSINTSSKATRLLASEFIKELGMTEKEYRKTLSELRKKIKVVERDMSANKWEDIDYENVPKRASRTYQKAFVKKDESRYVDFLERVSQKEVVIKEFTNFPYEVLHQMHIKGEDDSIEALWKALPEYGVKNTLVVADVSGSMDCPIGGRTTTALEVCISLALYCAERNEGPFKDQVVTFSEHPEYVHIPGNMPLKSRYIKLNKSQWLSNISIEAILTLILKTAVEHSCTQEEMPKNILFLSDVEFDECTKSPDISLITGIEEQYHEKGYELPRFAFWNLRSGTNTIPMRVNDFGVSLISGFNPAILKLVISGKLDPWDALKDKLESERYSMVNFEL